MNGQRKGKDDPEVDWTSPKMLSPYDSQRYLQERTMERATTMKRSGTYATAGYRGCSLFLISLSEVNQQNSTGGFTKAYLRTIMIVKLPKATALVKPCA